MDLSIIIVNWNSKEYLQKCIASILSETSGIDFEIIVIDAASYDGCDQMLRESYPQVKFIQAEGNTGFARANNAAFAASEGEYLLFLNPDTELVGPAINTLYAQLQKLPDAGAVGCRLLNSDRSIQTSCIKSFPTIVNQLLDADALRRCFPRLSLWGMAPLFGENKTPQPVDSISGACLMLPRKRFEQVDLFSTDYFMYSEDVDLCYKLRQSGWKNYYIPSAIIVHHGGASSSQSALSTFASVMFLESRWRFFKKTRGWWYCSLYRAGMFGVSLLRLAMALIALSLTGLVAAGARWKNVVKKWNARMRWTLGMENWVQDYGKRC